MSHRLIDLVAEDNAIEDTIYHLHRALNAGRIDLDRFLRVRLVSLSARAVLTAIALRANANTDDPCACRRAVHEAGTH
jgi:hypothetical protein